MAIVNTYFDNLQKLRGTTQALQIYSLSLGTRYEFMFTNLIPGNIRHFTSVVGVHKLVYNLFLALRLLFKSAVSTFYIRDVPSQTKQRFSQDATSDIVRGSFGKFINAIDHGH